jgi:hypothetical protein
MTIDPRTFWETAKTFAANGMQISDACKALGLNANHARGFWHKVRWQNIATFREIDDVQYQFYRNRRNAADRRYHKSRPAEKAEPKPEPIAEKPKTPDELWRAAMEGKRFDSLNIKPHTTTRFNAVQRPVATGGGSVLGSIVTGD